MRWLLTAFVLLLMLELLPADAGWPMRGGVASSTTGTSTINNRDAAGVQVGNWTTDGNFVVANAGKTIYYNGTYYRYGDNQSCGTYTNFVPGNANPYCGVAIYTTTDFNSKAWTYQGLLFDPVPFQASGTCAPGACFRPRVIYNVANNDWVVWFYQKNLGRYVFTCTSPTGGATPTTPGTGCTQQPIVSDTGDGDFDLFVDPNTQIAYLIGGLGAVGICQLNPAYTEKTASACTNIPVSQPGAEGVSMFYRAGTYYILYGPLCPYCGSLNGVNQGGVVTVYQTATSPLGPYNGTETQIAANSCGGQNNDITLVDTPGGTVYLWDADLWNGTPNQSQAMKYWQPLTFTGSAIDPIPCANTVTLSGVVLSPPPVKPAGFDQSSWLLGQFRPAPFIGNTDIFSVGVTHVLQTFVPTNSGTMTKARIALGLADFDISWGITGPTPDAPLTVSIVHVDGSHNPIGSPLSSITIPATSLNWGVNSYDLTGLATTLVGGTEYGIELSATTTFPTRYSFGLATNNPYPAGVYKQSVDGVTWTTVSGAILFSTYGP